MQHFASFCALSSTSDSKQQAYRGRSGQAPGGPCSAVYGHRHRPVMAIGIKLTHGRRGRFRQPPPSSKVSSSGRVGARRGRSSKTALVLGGGGFTGGVYEIGALRALDLLSVNRTVNQFDIYVGTSAGSLIAALVANGVTPEQMMRIVNNQVPTPFRDSTSACCCGPTTASSREALQLPLHLLGVAPVARRSLGSVSVVDLAIALADALPSGLYTGSRRSRTTSAPCSRTPTAPTTSACSRSELYLAGDRPRHLRADRARRRGLGRRADLHRRARLDRAADGLQARR